MKSLLSKIATRRGIGLYLGEREIVLSEVAATPLGKIEVSSRCEPCSPDNLAEAIERLLCRLRGAGKRRLSVAVGLPCSRVFFGTRPIRSDADSRPEAAMQKLLLSPNILIDDLAIDLIRGSANKTPLASVAACRKKYLATLLGALLRCGVRLVRTEPAACGLVRAATQSSRAQRRTKCSLHVFLSEGEGLAVFAVPDLPLGWRQFALPAGGEGPAILSAARTLISQSKFHGMDLPPDYIFVHGRADLHQRLKQERLPSELGRRVVWLENPQSLARTAALGVALGCLDPEAKAFDLSRTIKPRPSLWEIFPCGELACQAAMLIVMTLILHAHVGKLDDSYRAARAECAQHPCLASAKPADLEGEKKDLAQRLEALRRFLKGRIHWTAHLREIADRLPDHAVLSYVQGVSNLESGGKRKAHATASKKSLLLRAQAPLMADGSVPSDLSEFVVSLRGHPLLKKDFPLVQLTDIKQSQANVKERPSAVFTIVCLPKSQKGSKSAAKPGPANEDHKKEQP